MGRHAYEPTMGQFTLVISGVVAGVVVSPRCVVWLHAVLLCRCADVHQNGFKANTLFSVCH